MAATLGASPPDTVRSVGRLLWLAAVTGAGVGLLGGLVGLGGAEFRLPLLIRAVRFHRAPSRHREQGDEPDRRARAIPRLLAVPPAEVASHWAIVANLLVGSLLGAWLGAAWTTRMRAATLYRVLAILLVGIAAAFAAQHLGAIPILNLPPVAQATAGVVAGFGIGVVAAIMGVAGGELLIPTIVLLYGMDTRLAGSLSLLVSLPTMLVAFFRYSRDQAFTVLGQHPGFIAVMAGGSVLATFLGALLLGVVFEAVLVPLIVAVLLLSAVKVWRHA